MSPPPKLYGVDFITFFAAENHYKWRTMSNKVVPKPANLPHAYGRHNPLLLPSTYKKLMPYKLRVIHTLIIVLRLGALLVAQ